MLLSDVCLSDVRLSVAYIGPNSRTERHRKTKIGTYRGSPRHTWLGHQFHGQKVADVLNSQHAEIGATWRINMKILSTCRGLQLVSFVFALHNSQCCGRILTLYDGLGQTSRRDFEHAPLRGRSLRDKMANIGSCHWTKLSTIIQLAERKVIWGLCYLC